MKQKYGIPGFKELQEEAFKIHCKKNHDYATLGDPFSNFRDFGAYGVVVRMSDKMARIKNFVKNGKFDVKDEKFKDTCIDLANYALIAYLLFENEKKEK
jgi:hypothetical protein